MTKKHLITCSVLVLLVIVSAFSIRSTTATTEVKKPTKSSPSVAVIAKDSTTNLVFKNEDDDYTFANEAVPINNANVKRTLQRTLKRHDYRHVQSNILQVKAAQLFPVIEPILKSYGIPDDFKYIPLVESGLCEGTSPKGAKGIWQFMAGTARTYGLKVRQGVDERMDTRKSTIAACKYIKELYYEFNSWTLAAAAYNNGEIQLARAINRQNEDNYFLMHLNRETGAYVYNIIAMKTIINKPAKYGYKFRQNDFKPEQLMAFNPVKGNNTVQ